MKSCRNIISGLRYSGDEVSPTDFYEFRCSKNRLRCAFYRFTWMVVFVSFFTSHLIYDSTNLKTYIFYLTHWGEILIVVYMIWSFGVTIYGWRIGRISDNEETQTSSEVSSNPESDKRLLRDVDGKSGNHDDKVYTVAIYDKTNSEETPTENPERKQSKIVWFHKINWFLYEMSFVMSWTVTGIYWIFLHQNVAKVSFIIFNLYKHGLNAIVLTTDALITRYPVRFLHSIYGFSIGIFYVFLTFILHHISLKFDPENDVIPKQIYWFLDWHSGSFKPLFLCLAMVPVTCLLQGFLVLLHWLRSKFFKK